MGTTLTGTTPQDTYDSLIKVTDNGPLSGSLKKLTDGLGNDSSLSLSTAAASFSGTLAVTGNATFDTNTLFVDATNNRVGVGTITPQTTLGVVGQITATTSNFAPPSTGGALVMFQDNNDYATIWAVKDYNGDWANVTLCRLGGNVGIGTSSPAGNLHIASASDTGIRIQAGTSSLSYIDLADSASGAPAGSIAYNHIVDAIVFGVGGSNTERFRMTANGLCFNGDTAAANALDDYEEGTWTMGISFGGASVGVTTSANTGTYTKIGRQVTVNGLLTLTSKGSSTGSVNITGLPFAIANTSSNYSSATMRLSGVTFANQFQAYGAIGLTTIAIDEITEAGVVTELTNSDFANDTTVVVSLTYFV